MAGNSTPLKETLEQALRLPEIDGDACVHALLDRAGCAACVEACPRDAWILDEDALGLDTAGCDGCGLCIPACPRGALHLRLPWVIRSLGSQQVALFACERSAVKGDSARLPCIHALGDRQLLLLYNAGVHYLLLASGGCQGCERDMDDGIGKRLERINLLLAERRKPPMKLLERDPRVWERIHQADEVVTRGTRLARRAFLRGGTRQIREQMVVLDPLNLPETRTLPPGELLPESSADQEALHWPWSVGLDAQRCNGCDACTRLCPTQALELVREEEGSPAYRITTARCDGCGLCLSVCEEEAVTLEPWSLGKPGTLPLVERRCRSCGNGYHLPGDNPLSGSGLCRICQQRDHASNLFQVLQE